MVGSIGKVEIDGGDCEMWWAVMEVVFVVVVEIKVVEVGGVVYCGEGRNSWGGEGGERTGKGEEEEVMVGSGGGRCRGGWCWSES